MVPTWAVLAMALLSGATACGATDTASSATVAKGDGGTAADSASQDAGLHDASSHDAPTAASDSGSMPDTEGADSAEETGQTCRIELQTCGAAFNGESCCAGLTCYDDSGEWICVEPSTVDAATLDTGTSNCCDEPTIFGEGACAWSTARFQGQCGNIQVVCNRYLSDGGVIVGGIVCGPCADPTYTCCTQQPPCN